MTTILRRSPVLAFGIGVGLIMGAAELVGGGSPLRAALVVLIPIGYGALVTVLAQRSDTASVLAGRPVDERSEHINQEASAWALGLTAIVILAAFIVADASNGDWAPYAFIGAVMAVSYAGSLLVLQRRH
jgi:hypothetical protein